MTWNCKLVQLKSFWSPLPLKSPTPKPTVAQDCLVSVFPSLFFVISLVSSGLSSKRSSKLVLLTFVSAFHCCLGCFLPTIDHGLCHLCTLNKSLILLVFSLPHNAQTYNFHAIYKWQLSGASENVWNICTWYLLYDFMTPNETKFWQKIIKEMNKCIVSNILY